MSVLIVRIIMILIVGVIVGLLSNALGINPSARGPVFVATWLVVSLAIWYATRGARDKAARAESRRQNIADYATSLEATRLSEQTGRGGEDVT
jgi:hypothetical protein